MKHRIDLPILVEGKYDKTTLTSMFDATVVTLGGFSVFNSVEKQALIRKISARGVILITDPDGGGKQIRSFVNGIIPKDKIFNVYVPKIEGKERRKDKRSAAGLLGVEGMSREVLERALAPFIVSGDACKINASKTREMITKVDFFVDKLSGTENASERRSILAEYFGLPGDMTANALLEALNIIADREEYKKAIAELFGKDR